MILKQMIDTHVHLNDSKLYNKIDELIIDAYNSGIDRMIVIGYDRKSSQDAIDIAQKYPNIYAAVGLHPHGVVDEDDTELEWLKQMLSNPKIIAIGEIGIDLYWTKENKELQINYFNKQLAIAMEYNVPVIIHSREAIEITYECLCEYKLNGIIHCYSGSLEMAHKFIDLGYYLGIGGVITYSNAKVREVVKEISLQYLLSETDAPYLTPVPYRGKVNEPRYIKVIVEEIARLKEISVEEVIAAINNNVYKLFKI